MVEVGEKYRHFKGGEYEVIALARDCESLEDVVVYRALYSTGEFEFGQIWTRSLEDFNGFVLFGVSGEIDNGRIDGEKFKRFELIG